MPTSWSTMLPQVLTCIHGTVCLPRPQHEVYLVNEQHNLALSILDLLQHCLEALLKLATVFGTCSRGAARPSALHSCQGN